MLKKNSNKSSRSIVTIDPYLENAFRFTGNEVEVLNASNTKSNKNQFYISYIKFKHLINSVIEIPRSVNEDDIVNIISIRAYEELSLDPSVDYKISYLETASTNTESRTFSVFAIDSQNISKIFHDTVRNTKYIDYIALAPLLYGAAYKKSLLSTTDVDCFINISKDDAFLTIYKGGEYFLSRPLRYNLTYIKDKFCEQAGERISDQAFFGTLKTDGLNFHDDSNIFSKMVGYVLDDCFSYVSDIINSINRIYGLNINNVFLDTDIGNVKNLCEYITKKLDIETKYLSINLAINSKDFNITQQHNLMAIEASYYQDSLDDEFNFSVFKRPDPFIKRKSGKFIMTFVASLILAFAYPAFNYIYGFILESDSDRMYEEYLVLSALEKNIQAKLNIIAKEKKEVEDSMKKEEERLKFRKALLQEIYDKKNNYKMKSIIMYELSEFLNKNNVKLNQVSGDNKSIIMSVRADNDKKITELIKDISMTAKYAVSTKEIYSMETPVKSYESNITVEIR